MERMEPRITLVTLGVRDLDRSLRFYRDGLGWPVSSASVEGEVVFFRSSGAVLALYPRELLAKDAHLPPDGSGFGGIALAQNVHERAEVDAILAQATAAGGTILKPAEQADWGGYHGYFADPDGFPWEIAWNPGFPFAPDGSLDLPI
jgi:catechol 2,3-dioxygenase-like lactoylglutathione lyase family enzyme